MRLSIILALLLSFAAGLLGGRVLCLGRRYRRNSAMFVSPIRLGTKARAPTHSAKSKPMNTLPLLKRLVDVESPKGIVPSSFAPSVPGLDELLAWKNGFYAYSHGLHVFGRCTKPRWHSLETWNNPAGWIREYGEFAEGLFFFAEDSFGDQFAWDGEQIVRFIAETGECEKFASDLEDWLEQIVSNPREELGLEVLKDWIKAKGPVPEGLHLFPRTPLVAGGSLDPSEIVTLDPFENMGFKASLAQQIADVPDGQQIELVVQPPPGANRSKK